ncbi:MAG: molybdopterin-binding protein [Caulobacter sp.]|nr:molybdopterin-binding protein [Caulobacter sp.]
MILLPKITRRRALIGSLGLTGLALAGCDKIAGSDSVSRVLSAGEAFTRTSQRLVLGKNAPLAREYKASDISPNFKANGTVQPETDVYKQAQGDNFATWRLGVFGLVTKPLSLSLAELQRLPARTQITRHDCVEGWSAIGGWTGVPLGLLLQAAGMQPSARYAVFHCADLYDGDPYYESIDLIDAFHPQTLLAYAMNGSPLSVAHGAPLRLRLERQLGYKQAKYVMGVELVDSFARLGKGKGGYWEDNGYEWYAGI